MKVNYYLAPNPDQEGKHRIRLYISHAGERFFFNTGMKSTKADWVKPKFDKDSNLKHLGRIKANGPINRKINDNLAKWEVDVNQLYLKALNDGEMINQEYFEKNLSFVQSKENDFFAVWDEYVQSTRIHKAWSQGYETQVGVVKNKLMELNKAKKIKFTSIDHKFLNRFIDLHIKEYRVNSYTNQNIVSLKVFLTWATKHDLNRNMTYQKWDVKLPEPGKDENIYYLTIDELNRLLAHKYRDPEIRDSFLFQCFTGLRYSDLKKLQKTDIHDDHISITTKKTRKRIDVPLNDVSRSILDKYKDSPSNNALPVPYPNKYNQGIKDLGRDAKLNRIVDYINYCGREPNHEKCKLYEKMTSHTGRKTFITMAVYLDIPLEVVIAITGQSYEVAKRYYKIQDQHKSREMDKFNTNLKIVS